MFNSSVNKSNKSILQYDAAAIKAVYYCLGSYFLMSFYPYFSI